MLLKWRIVHEFLGIKRRVVSRYIDANEGEMIGGCSVNIRIIKTYVFRYMLENCINQSISNYFFFFFLFQLFYLVEN